MSIYNPYTFLRMRGLLGDATEEFIETLDNKDTEDQDEEEIYKMANVMTDCGGLQVMLNRLASVQDSVPSKHLLVVLLKLFDHCVKVKKNRETFLNPELKAIPILLRCVKLCLGAGMSDPGSQGGPCISEQVLQIMEKLLVEATVKQNTIEVRFNEFELLSIFSISVFISSGLLRLRVKRGDERRHPGAFGACCQLEGWNSTAPKPP